MLDHLGSEALDKNVHPIHEPIINSKTNPAATRRLSTFVSAQPGRAILVILPLALWLLSLPSLREIRQGSKEVSNLDYGRKGGGILPRVRHWCFQVSLHLMGENPCRAISKKTIQNRNKQKTTLSKPTRSSLMKLSSNILLLFYVGFYVDCGCLFPLIQTAVYSRYFCLYCSILLAWCFKDVLSQISYNDSYRLGTQSVKFLLDKNEDPSSIPCSHIVAGHSGCSHNASVGELGGFLELIANQLS